MKCNGLKMKRTERIESAPHRFLTERQTIKNAPTKNYCFFDLFGHLSSSLILFYSSSVDCQKTTSTNNKADTYHSVAIESNEIEKNGTTKKNAPNLFSMYWIGLLVVMQSHYCLCFQCICMVSVSNSFWSYRFHIVNSGIDVWCGAFVVFFCSSE